jgi:GT2 family glycosyltransferase
MKSNYKYNVSIIIISHNHENYLVDCIDSIYQKTEDISFEIILIDNLSKGICASLIKNKYNNVILIENSEVKGFSENNNVGIIKSMGEYVLILNPDTILKNNAIKILYNFMLKTSMVGVAGPKIFFPNDTLQFSSRKFPSFISFIKRRTPIRGFFEENKRDAYHLMADWHHNSTCTVDWLLGACLMVKRKRIISIGMFDEKYKLYCEDIDLCFSFNQIGYNNYYVNEAEIYHYHQQESDKKFFSKRTWTHYKSMFHFFKKHKYWVYIFK